MQCINTNEQHSCLVFSVSFIGNQQIKRFYMQAYEKEKQ